jgi:2-dehydro-3-deoxyphosphogluconate aldolase/(4S)-4-hydroxy-2-oxoglutarate aldolase
MSFTKTAVLDRIRALGLLAVIRGPSAAATLKAVHALVRGGVLGIEITYSTPEAPDVVQRLKDKYGDDVLLGMGTLTRPAQAQEASAAGAQFLVSPHTEDKLGESMFTTGLAVMFGALTPSEVVRANELGADIVKIFPGSLGGPRYLKSLRGPLPDIPMMPTGGVTADNVEEWFAAGAVAVGACGALCPANLIREGRFEEIEDRARVFATAVRQARIG